MISLSLAVTMRIAPRNVNVSKTQAVRPLHQYGFLKTLLAFRAGVVDPRQRAQRAQLLVALVQRFDQLARTPTVRGSWGVG